ncbi:ABL204Wp [Eremothecium gossypii ATCC 10895]|uniref:Cysteine proteinase 1, mitochondrial n=1 Tax=Eremothecium gossypii (strain ATCC 10895 / CBS 109.51 / FGSC 9923 / NRRL Y-1056) TaxID=284811 RepID=Q75E86_EREGS|nr:ABL204Wp [Eremothecium gossypii ATCC 10895]AAS50567.1 ABL204Wp [Eremothecium gossypii ATCC 10895]
MVASVSRRGQTFARALRRGLTTSVRQPNRYRAMSIEITDLARWDQELKADINHGLASTVLKNYNADEVLLDKTQLLKHYPRVFNVGLSEEVGPVTNQRSSGRCWLFAATNELRLNVAQKLNLKEFELSQAYLFFYDKLEKANYFLDQIVDTANEEVESRLVQYLLTSPVQDGGQYSMFVNLVRKYGVLPKDLYADLAFSTTNSAKWNSLLTTKLREFGQELREAAARGEDVSGRRTSMQKELVRLMSLFMDLPPYRPDEEFTWEYTDKDGKTQSLFTTPLQFAREHAGLDIAKPVSLINDPRHPYGSLIKIDRLGNVLGGDEVRYLNVDNDTLSALVVKRLRNKRPVFFGSHTPKFMSKQHGVLDTRLWNYRGIGYEFTQDKASRIRYGESLMTHAMLITGVHVDSADKPIRYKVENSWGKDIGKDGYFVMTQEYFEEYSFQIVVDIDELPEELAAKFQTKEEKPIVLPIWDPMGALAQ